MNRLGRFLRGIFLLLLILPVMIVQAQQDEMTYTAADHSITVDYPSNWNFDLDERSGFLYLQDDALHLTLYSPTVLNAYLIGNIVDPAILVDLVMTLNDLETLDLTTTRIDNRDAATYRYVNPIENNSGMLTAIRLRDGRLGLVDAYREDGDIAAVNEQIIDIIASFDVPPAPAPESLVASGEAWQAVTAELEASQLIEPGGELVFAQPYAFVSGVNNAFQPLAQQAQHENVIVAGKLTLTSTTPQGETCSLAARVAAQGSIEVGLSSEGALVAAEIDSDGERLSEQVVPLESTPNQAQQVLFLVLGERLVVYVNNELVISDLPITARTGSYGLSLRANGSSATCEVSQLWVYQLPATTPNGACLVSAEGGAANQRSGPGVSFEIAGQLAAGTSADVVSQIRANDGFIWWQLADMSWVREDVVSEAGDCAAIPQATVPTG
ncbi:MAG: hypothetical protein K8L99_20115 [Anaerolineae bacterium]|nr:hypothetical protein [Anaerolineae bacterium]